MVKHELHCVEKFLSAFIIHIYTRLYIVSAVENNIFIVRHFENGLYAVETYSEVCGGCIYRHF